MLVAAAQQERSKEKTKNQKNPKTERLGQVINGNAVQLQLEMEPEGEGGEGGAAATVADGSCSPYCMFILDTPLALLMRHVGQLQMGKA